MASIIELQGFGVKLRTLTLEDLELVRQWRNHPDIANNMFGKTHITSQQHQQWLKSLAERDDQCHFLITSIDGGLVL